MESDARTAEGTCLHLRCKGMFVRGTTAPESEYAGDTTHWWCALSCYAVGPDQDWVHRSACVPGRSCHVPRGGPADPA